MRKSTVPQSFSQEIFALIKKNAPIKGKAQKLDGLKQGDLQLSKDDIDGDSLNTLHLLAHYWSVVQESIISKIDSHALAIMLQQQSKPMEKEIPTDLDTPLKPAYYVDRVYSGNRRVIAQEGIAISNKDQFLAIVTKHSGLLPIFEYLNFELQKNGEFDDLAKQYANDFYQIVHFLNENLSTGSSVTAVAFRDFLAGRPPFSAIAEYRDLRIALSSLDDASLQQAIVTFKKFLAENSQHPVVQAVKLDVFADANAKVVVEQKVDTTNQTPSTAASSSSVSPKADASTSSSPKAYGVNPEGQSQPSSEIQEGWVARPHITLRRQTATTFGEDSKRDFNINSAELKSATESTDMTIRYVNQDASDEISEIHLVTNEDGAKIKFIVAPGQDLAKLKKTLEQLAQKSSLTTVFNVAGNVISADMDFVNNRKSFNFMGRLCQIGLGPDKKTLIDGYMTAFMQANTVLLHTISNLPKSAKENSEPAKTKNDREKYRALKQTAAALDAKLNGSDGVVESLKLVKLNIEAEESRDDKLRSLDELKKDVSKIEAKVEEVKTNLGSVTKALEQFVSKERTKQIEQYLSTLNAKLNAENFLIRTKNEIDVLREKHILFVHVQDNFEVEFDEGASSRDLENGLGQHHDALDVLGGFGPAEIQELSRMIEDPSIRENDDEQKLEEVTDTQIEKMAQENGVSPNTLVSLMKDMSTTFSQRPLSANPSKYCKEVSFWRVKKVQDSSAPTLSNTGNSSEEAPTDGLAS